MLTTPPVLPYSPSTQDTPITPWMYSIPCSILFPILSRERVTFAILHKSYSESSESSAAFLPSFLAFFSFFSFFFFLRSAFSSAVSPS